MYREIDMRFWLEQAQVRELSQTHPEVIALPTFSWVRRFKRDGG
jgi:hypothetical protein